MWNASNCDTYNLLELIFLKYKYLNLFNIRQSDYLEINEKSFENAFELNSVYLQKNQIKKLEGNIFKNSINLQYFDASINLIEKIDSQTFKGLKSLNTIDLSRNLINHIEIGSFDHLNLDSLNLIRNEIVEFNFQSLNVKNLNVQNNVMTKVTNNKNFGNDLERLDIACNNLTTIDSTFFQNLIKIQHFFASYNFIEHLNSEIFQNLKYLQLVDLSYNRLESIENGTFLNLNLFLLNLEGNLLIEFDFQYLIIEHINLSRNQLVSVLVNGKNITKLFLNDNKISRLDLEIRTLQELAINNNDRNIQIHYV